MQTQICLDAHAYNIIKGIPKLQYTTSFVPSFCPCITFQRRKYKHCQPSDNSTTAMVLGLLVKWHDLFIVCRENRSVKCSTTTDLFAVKGLGSI